jgi:hypothetical protein
MPAKKSQKPFSLQKKATFSYAQVLVFIVVFGVFGVIALTQSFAAGKGGGKGGGGKPVKNNPNGLSYTVTVDNNGDGLPNWNDTVRFSINQTATTEPHVALSCSQNGTVVYNQWTGYFDGYPWPWTQNMQLSSQAWTGGAADCTANWYYFNGTKTIDGGTLLFHVNA